MSHAPTQYPDGTETRGALIERLASMQISGPAAETIAQMTSHKRHEARVKVVADTLGLSHPVPPADGSRRQVWLLLVLVADTVGVGGHAGVTGDGTGRVPALESIPTKQSMSGGAWSAAVEHVLDCLAGGWTLRMRSRWTGARPDDATDWVTWPSQDIELMTWWRLQPPSWSDASPSEEICLHVQVEEGKGKIFSDPLGADRLGRYHLTALAHYMCAAHAGAVEARHRVSVDRSDIRHWSALAMALAGQWPREGWSVITDHDSPGCLGDLEIVI